MEIAEARLKFIHGWGQLGASWGINRTMAQIQALLLLSPKALSTDEIMEQLKISRGNTNMNLRELVSWGTVYKSFIPGDRKEYFYSEKSMWELAKKVSRERKKRELEPLVKMLEEVKQVNGESEDAIEFRTVVNNARKMSKRAGGLLDNVVNFEEKIFFKWMGKKGKM